MLILLVLAFSSYAAANAITFTGTGTGTTAGHSASATFSLTGTTLTVTLVNTSTGDAKDAAGLLLGLFFDTSTPVTPVSALLPPGTTTYCVGSCLTTFHNVGAGWEFKSGLGTTAQGMNSGIAGAGFGVFGPLGNFFSPGVHLSGTDYGIAPKGFTNTGNSSVVEPIFKNSIQFTLHAPGFSLSELGKDVVFQYGSSLSGSSDGHFLGTHSVVPEPATLALFGAGVLGLAGIRRRSK